MEATLSARLKAQTTATVLVILAGIAAIVAHGSDDSGGSSATNQFLSVIQGSTGSLDTARSVNVVINETVTEYGQSQHLSIETDADRVTHDARSTVHALDGATRHLRHVGYQVYARVSPTTRAENAEKAWAEFTYQPTAAEQALQGSSGLGYLKLLGGAHGSVTRVGDETVNGVPTTEYDVHVDATTLVGPMIQQLEPGVTTDQLDSLGFNNLPVKVWLDRQGVVRQLTLTLSSGGATATVTASATPSQQPVTTSAPPANQVNEVSSLLEWTQLVNGTTSTQ